METAFHVPAISCEGCARTINEALRAVVGVKSVQVDVPRKQVVVFSEGSATPEQLEVRSPSPVIRQSRRNRRRRSSQSDQKTKISKTTRHPIFQTRRTMSAV